MDNKLATITQLFEGREIRSIWDPEIEDYYFSVIDVITILADPGNPSDYWYQLKKRMTEEEKSELSTNCRQLKIKSLKDGKRYMTDTLNTTYIFRLVESIPSQKAEPFKMWLASLGKERIDEVFDPEKAINRAIDYYRRKGCDDKWIEARIKASLNRKKLTDVWKSGGIKEEFEYGILTNEIYKEWSGMTAGEYKSYKGIRKENLRDNMTDIEIALTDLGELVTRHIAQNEKPIGLKENQKTAKRGGNVARKTKEFYEETTGLKVITKDNYLNYKYINDDIIDSNDKD